MSTETPGTDMVFATASLKDRMDWSRAIAGAGNLVPAGFRDGPNANPAKILLAVEYGAMLGLHPMAALSGIHVIDGKPTLSAALMSAQVHKAGHQLRITTTGTVTGTGNTLGGDFTATVTLVRKDDPKHPFVVTWTIDRAKRAGLWGKGNWAKYPENQMTWRAVAEAVRNGAPEVLLGVWHTPDELGATVSEDGDVIDAEEVEQDHDGPNVTTTMRRDSRTEPGSVKKTEARQRDAGDAAPDPQPTVAQRSRPGGSRSASKTEPGSADGDQIRDRFDVADEWAAQVQAVTDLAVLYKLHDDAAARRILDHRISSNEHTVEDVFVIQRTRLQDAGRQTDAGEPDEPLFEDDVDLDSVPF